MDAFEQELGNDKLNLKIGAYLNNFSKEKLGMYEDIIFSNKIDKAKRAELELDRLKSELVKLPELYALYLEEVVRLGKLLEVSDFDSTVLDEIYASILRIELEHGIKIRLYSGIPILKEELDKEQASLNFSRR